MRPADYVTVECSYCGEPPREGKRNFIMQDCGHYLCWECLKLRYGCPCREEPSDAE